MRLTWSGHWFETRELHGLMWEKANNHTVDVTDAAVLADALSQPGEEFRVANDEPLLKLGIKARVCAQLPLAGIASVADLAVVKNPGEVAEIIQQPAETVAGWVAAAKAALKESAA